MCVFHRCLLSGASEGARVWCACLPRHGAQDEAIRPDGLTCTPPRPKFDPSVLSHSFSFRNSPGATAFLCLATRRAVGICLIPSWPQVDLVSSCVGMSRVRQLANTGAWLSFLAHKPWLLAVLVGASFVWWRCGCSSCVRIQHTERHPSG
jgi:hypothetical protein